MKEGLKELTLHMDFVLNTLPIVITEPMMELIDSGLFYNYGRDKSLCPIMFFCPKVVSQLKCQLEDSILATHYIAQYVLHTKMHIGKVENWITVIDAAHLGIFSIPKKWVIQFVKTFNHHYYQTNK
jgi:hypothetical protein